MSFHFGSEITTQVYQAIQRVQRSPSPKRVQEVAQATLDQLAKHCDADGYADVRLTDGTVLTIIAKRPS